MKTKLKIKEVEKYLKNLEPSGFAHAMRIHSVKSDFQDLKKKKKLNEENIKELNNIISTIKEWTGLYNGWNKEEFEKVKKELAKTEKEKIKWSKI